MKSIAIFAIFVIAFVQGSEFDSFNLGITPLEHNQTANFLSGFVYGVSNMTYNFTNFTLCSQNQTNKFLKDMNTSMIYFRNHWNLTSFEVHQIVEYWYLGLKHLYRDHTRNCTLAPQTNKTIDLIRDVLRNHTKLVEVKSPGVIYIGKDNVSWRFRDSFYAWNASNWTQFGLDVGYLSFQSLEHSKKKPKGYVELSL